MHAEENFRNTVANFEYILYMNYKKKKKVKATQLTTTTAPYCIL